MNEDSKMNVELKIKEIETILVGLNELPHKTVRSLIDNIVTQVNQKNNSTDTQVELDKKE